MSMTGMDVRLDRRFEGIESYDNKIWLSSPTMHGDEMKYVIRAYETSWMSTAGGNINELEKMAETYVGVKHAVALSSGTAALHLVVKLAAERLYCSSSGASTPDGLGAEGLASSQQARFCFCGLFRVNEKIN